jgi:hypothetical protein
VDDVRVRPAGTEEAQSFSEMFEQLGGTALPVGQTLELVHPSGDVGFYEEVELRFFVRAWSLAIGRRCAMRIVEPDGVV